MPQVHRVRAGWRMSKPGAQFDSRCTACNLNAPERDPSGRVGSSYRGVTFGPGGSDRPVRGHGRWPMAGTRGGPLAHTRRFRGRHHAAAISWSCCSRSSPSGSFPRRKSPSSATARPSGSARRSTRNRKRLARPTSRSGPVTACSWHPTIVTLCLAVQRARPVTVAFDGETVAFARRPPPLAAHSPRPGWSSGPATRCSWTVSPPPIARPRRRQVRITVRAFCVHGIVQSRRPALSGTRPPATVSSIDTAARHRLRRADGRQLLADLGVTVREGDLVRPPTRVAGYRRSVTVHLTKARTVSSHARWQGNVSLHSCRDGRETSSACLASSAGGRSGPLVPHGGRLFNGMQVRHRHHARSSKKQVAEPIPAPTVVEVRPAPLPRGEVRIVTGQRRASASARIPSRTATARRSGPRRCLFGGDPGGRPDAPHHRHARRDRPPAADNQHLRRMHRPRTAKRCNVWATWYNANHGACEPRRPALRNHRHRVSIVAYGICAVDPSVIPMDTRFYGPRLRHVHCSRHGRGDQGLQHRPRLPGGRRRTRWRTGYVDIYIVD